MEIFELRTGTMSKPRDWNKEYMADYISESKTFQV